MKNTDYMSCAPHSAAINVTGSNKVKNNNPSYTGEGRHSFSVCVGGLPSDYMHDVDGSKLSAIWSALRLRLVMQQVP